MGKPLSMDLRLRALAAVDEGMSYRAAAVRLGVAAATVSGGTTSAAARAPMPPGRRHAVAARRIIEAWRTDYNTVRPHSSLGGMAPAEFTNRPRHGHEDTEARAFFDQSASYPQFAK
ncbi:transposase (plasmid) [Sphingomonas paucimobilis]|uniref:DNA, contig: SP662 n=1 Tax=Sphingomonas paucimobilis NBRC 13935 TaxID=1219050 RepID=A0A0C9NHI4_SPHPI|nr:transposase [Sphingomonas paucimobilis]GAN15672.1 hypothetical protein SP6_62_00490 [Sphingomonas paucimobilis NBRC 13935]SUK11982.1 Transposase and inactivated derivatives [Sphingomonas paucimobilis]